MPYETPDQFDSRRFVQLARTEIEEETKGMSPGQIVQYYRTYPYEAPHAEIDATRLPWWGEGSGGDPHGAVDGNFDCIGFVRRVRREMAAEREGAAGNEARGQRMSSMAKAATGKRRDEIE